MPVETAADRAALFNTDEFAVSGSWTLAAGGATATVPVVLSRADERVDLGGPVGMRLPEVTALANVDDLPAGYGTGDTLVADGVTFTVQRVDLDETRTIATALLRAV